MIFFFFQAEDGIRDGHVTGVQTCALPIFLPDRFLVISADVYRFVISDILSLVILNRFITIIANGRVFIILYRFGSIVINGKCLIVLDLNVVVFFSVNQYLFRAFFVLKAQLVIVIRGGVFCGSSFNAALVSRRLRWFIPSVIARADDDGAILVTIEKIDDNFVADARNERRTPLIACPRLNHPKKAGAILVLLAFSIPIKLNFYAAQFVDINLFARWTHHERTLRPSHGWPLMLLLGPYVYRSWHAVKVVLVTLLAFFAGIVGPVLYVVADTYNDIGAFLSGGFMLCYFELSTGHEAAAVAAR